MPAYNINKSNGTPVTIPEGAIDTQFDIPLVGQNATNYGDDVAQAFLRLLENFANTTAPIFGTGRTIGQLWYDTANTQLKVWNGAAWDPLVVDSGGLTVTGDILPDADNVNDLGSAGLRYAEIWTNNLRATGTVFTTAISSGSNVTPGTIEGAWTLTAGSTLRATYADLAERYEADAIYPEGTVVKIGGEKEITATTDQADTDVFGVISTTPAFGLNAAAGTDDTHPYVAIAGRVPVRVIGSVRKGQRLVTSNVAGFAVAADSVLNVSPYAVVGRALENKTTETEGTVLAVVGAR
jgi:hypothetical protein